jgi:hypothetical protein
MRIVVVTASAIALFFVFASSVKAADSYTECVPSEGLWEAEKLTASLVRAQRILEVTPKRCVDLKRRVTERIRVISEQKPPRAKALAHPKTSPPPPSAVCKKYGAGATQVSITPHKTNFAKGDAGRLQRMLGCSKFKVVYGTNSLYKDVPIEIVTYIGPLQVERLRTLLQALYSIDVFVKHVCVDSGANARMHPNMFMLTGKGPGAWENLGPITPELITRLGTIQTEAQALEVLGDHACHATSSAKDLGF